MMKSIPITQDTKNDYYKALFVSAVIIFSAFITVWLNSFRPHSNEWAAFFAVGMTIPFSYFFYSKFFNSSELTFSKKLFLQVVSLFSLIFLGIVIHRAMRSQWINTTHLINMLSFIGIFIFSIITVLQEKSNLSIRNVIFLIIWNMVGWCSLFQLPNWQSLMLSLSTQPLLTTLFCLSCFIVSLAFVFSDQFPLLNKANNYKTNLTLFLFALTLIVSLSFRSDTLFFGGSQYHWEYFVGPIRTVKNGGWLLWDAPSQYGFLNILIAALLPTKSSWQSLYLLQGFLLMVTALIMYSIMINTANLLKSSIAILLIISSLYFADPDLIGPFLYPSSSVIRFFWCYSFLLLFYVYWRNVHFSLRQFLSYGTLLWIPACLWSAESAIYCTITFYSALIVLLAQEYLKSKRLFNAWNVTQILKYLFIPGIALLIVASLISVYFKFFLGYFPDWVSFFIYGFSYAAGYAALPLDHFGSVWILILLLISTAGLLVHVGSTNFLDRALIPIAGTIGCLWSISSYFIGRSVANNITAILPLLTLMIVLMLNIITSSNKDRLPHFIFRSLATPFLFIILITFGNTAFTDKLMHFQTFSKNIAQHLASAKSSLQLLMQKAGAHSNDAFVYYAYDGALSKLTFNKEKIISENTWLPTPLQLLNDPITYHRRHSIIKRFAARSTKGGYLIHAKGELAPQFEAWLDTLNKHYTQTQKFENAEWQIYQFVGKKNL